MLLEGSLLCLIALRQKGQTKQHPGPPAEVGGLVQS